MRPPAAFAHLFSSGLAGSDKLLTDDNKTHQKVASILPLLTLVQAPLVLFAGNRGARG